MDHAPIAWPFTAALLGSVAQWAVDVALVAPLRETLGVAAAWTGWARATGHLVDAIWLVWPASLLGAALVVYAGRSARVALAGWVACVAALVLLHPMAGDGSQGRLLGGAEAAAVVGAVALCVAWFRRTTRPPTPAHVVLTILVVNEAAWTLTRWAGPFGRWPIMQASALVLLGLISLIQGRYLWAPRLSTS